MAIVNLQSKENNFQIARRPKNDKFNAPINHLD